MSENQSSGVPRVELRDPSDEVGETLSRLQRLVLSDPDRSAAVFASLVAEGREFAGTGEGRKWVQRLEGSALLRRASVLWDTTTLWMLAERKSETPTSAYLDAIFLGASAPDGDSWLAESLRRSNDGD